MKKFFILIFACILCLSLIACDVSVPTTPENNDQTPTTGGEENPSTTGGEETPSTGEETPSTGEETPSTGEETPSTGEETPVTPKAEWLNVAHYNILFCLDFQKYSAAVKGWEINPDPYVEYFKDNPADIISLNEVDINNKRSAGSSEHEYYTKYGCNQPKYITEKLTEQTGVEYYYAYAASLNGAQEAAFPERGTARYGSAIISRYPIVATRSFSVAAHKVDPLKPSTQFGPMLPDGNYYEQKTVLIAEIDVDGTIVTVISAHFGLADDERQMMREKLIEEVAKIETPVILMGDFNSQPTDVNILELNKVLNPAGGADNNDPTFEKGRHIDYIYTSDGIEVKDYAINYDYTTSDHYPVTVKVRLPQNTQE